MRLGIGRGKTGRTRVGRWVFEDCERRFLFCAYHLDPAAEVPAAGLMGPVAAAVGASPLSSVPLLHSRSSATAKLYLDFDGDTTSTWGSYSPGTTPAYDVDGDASSFSDQELANIRFIWAKVAEKYAPFNIDVTTEYPGDLNNKHALRAVIGGNGAWFAANTGGVGYVGGFSNSDPNTVYVFSNNLSSPNSVGEAASHESGHGFGLEHQSTYSGTTKTGEYNHGDSLRAPVMGNSYSAQRGLWWYGPNTYGSTTIQDDLAVISGTANGFGYRTDDFGGTAGTAASLTLSGTTFSASGVIEKATDADWFKFVATAGSSVTLSASIGSYIRANAGMTVAGDGTGATLDAMIELRDASGNLIASADTASLGETLSASGLAAGTYYFVVKSHGSYGDIGTYDVTGTLTPGQGNTPPTANAGGSYAAAEGGSVVLNGAGSTNGSGGSTGLTYLWDLDGDGVFGETGAGATRGNETGVSPTLIATGLDGPSTYVVSLKVTDSATGLTSSVATANVSITNVAPTPTITGAPASSPEGTAINLTGSATDPGTPDSIAYAWSVTKNGSAYASGSGATFAFTPNDNATYSVTLTATDDDGGVGTASKTITVTNVTPTATIVGAPASSLEGAAIGLTGSAVDPGVLDTLSYAWAVTKNGVAFANGSGTSFGFTPSDNGTYVVTLTITDSDGAAGTASKTIAVANVAPTVAVDGAPPTSPEGTAIALTASATDPGTLDTFTYAWSVTKNGAAYASGGGASFTMTPNDNGTYVVTLTATDKDGGVGTTSRTIAVTNVAPTPSISGAPTNTTEGAVIPMTAAAADPGSAEAITYAWSVTKDGAAYSSGAGATFSLTANDNGTYVVTLTATDDDGGVGTTSNTIAVANVAPFVTISGATASRPEGSAAPLTAVATDPGTAEALTYAWAVTRDGQAYASGTGSAWSFTPGDDGAYVVTVTVTDKDGGVGTDTETLTVTNVAPTLTLGGATEVVTGTSFLLGLSASDPGQDTVASWTIDWGDGSVETIAGNPQSAGHVYAVKGSYTISASASDEDGTYAASNTRVVAVVEVVDTTPPTATLAWVGTLTAGAATQTFGVEYSDDVAFDASTLGDDDVLVSGPNGFSQWAHFVEYAIQIDGGGRVATYSFTPPGGGAWSYAANGNYTFTLGDGRVADAAGNAAAGGTLGGFAARLAVPDLGGNTADAAAYIGIVSTGYNTTSSDYLSKGDRNDYFRLRLKSTTAIDVKLYGMTEDADVQLIDGYGKVVQTSARAGTRSEIITRTLAAGTYYLRAYYSGTASTPYWLRVSSGVALAAPVAVAAPVPVSRPVAGSAASLFGTQRITVGAVDEVLVG